MKKDFLILAGIGAGIYFLSRKTQSVSGINERIDLFENYEKIPPKILKILNKYENAFMDGDYKLLTEALNLVRKNGYTFEFYLDGQAYGLRPINVPLKKLKGYENIGYNKHIDNNSHNLNFTINENISKKEIIKKWQELLKLYYKDLKNEKSAGIKNLLLETIYDIKKEIKKLK
jgi:hypothetical protein